MSPCAGILRDQAGPATIRKPNNQEKTIGERVGRRKKHRTINKEERRCCALAIKAVRRNGRKPSLRDGNKVPL